MESVLKKSLKVTVARFVIAFLIVLSIKLAGIARYVIWIGASDILYSSDMRQADLSDRQQLWKIGRHLGIDGIDSKNELLLMAHCFCVEVSHWRYTKSISRLGLLSVGALWFTVVAQKTYLHWKIRVIIDSN